MDIYNDDIPRSRPSVCIPIAARGAGDLERHIAFVKDMSPDLVEFRADYYRGPDCAGAAKIISDGLPGMPLIFTFRKRSEGGARDMEESERTAVILNAISSGYISAVDIEESTVEDRLEEVAAASRSNGIPVIMSYHDFFDMPSYEKLRSKIHNMKQKGADVAKISVTPSNRSEAFAFIDNFVRIKRDTDMPTIAVTMGEHGLFLRLFGWVLDNPIIYAAGLVPTAPGQPPAQFIRWFEK